MKRAFLVTAAALITAGMATKPVLAQEALSAFALKLPIATSEPAPYYRLSVPLAAYTASRQADLGDLRVFNGDGQPVPFARLRDAGQTVRDARELPLRAFPIRARTSLSTTTDGTTRLTVRQNADGSLVQIERSGAAHRTGDEKGSAGQIAAHVLDASVIAAGQHPERMQIDWAPEDDGLHLVDVEASDDLQHWRVLQSGAQLARLQSGGAQIERRDIDVSALRERYMRLTWRSPAPRLRTVTLRVSTARWQAAPLAWSAPVDGQTLSAGSGYAYRLPRALPVARLRVSLPAANAVLPVDVVVPARNGTRDLVLTRTVLYRIASAGHEWTQDEVELGGAAVEELALRFDTRSSAAALYGQGAPRISYGVMPEQVVFLASGKPPFTLASGNANARDASLPVATLVPGFDTERAPAIAAAEAKAQNAELVSTRAPADEGTPRPWLLWSLLGLGVLAMAAMAIQLVRQMRASPSADSR